MRPGRKVQEDMTDFAGIKVKRTNVLARGLAWWYNFLR